MTQHIGKRVFVYFNLHKRVWSVRHRGLVIGHAIDVSLLNPVFRVSEAGRQRVLREKRKNVHAGISGIWVAPHAYSVEGKQVSYNPYRAGYFYDRESGAPVHTAEQVHMRTAFGKGTVIYR